MKRTLNVFASEARTATPTAVTLKVPQEAEAASVVVEVTAAADTPSVVFAFNLVDPTSGTVVAILTSAAVTAVSSNIYKISPHLTASANLIAKDHLPPLLQITATHADADSITYSASIHFA